VQARCLACHPAALLWWTRKIELTAVILTTNLPFSEWTQVIPNARLCKALLDRITDRAHIIETGTDSYPHCSASAASTRDKFLQRSTADTALEIYRRLTRGPDDSRSPKAPFPQID
jgi:hypothetical protein